VGERDGVAKARWPLKLFRLTLRALFRVLFRIRVDGLDYLPDRPMIVALNHLGWVDPFLPRHFFPIEPRLYVLGERDVMTRSAWRRWVIASSKSRLMNAIYLQTYS
jgi:1-acyl-sn-glycerol-3-phosphate acyltransferase